MFNVKKWVIAVGMVTLAVTAEAALVDRGGGLIYDDVLHITWLQDANLAATNSFGVIGIATVGGGMPWAIAQNWIAAMNAESYLGYSDWRLPTTTQPDPTCSNQFEGGGFGYGCTGSELGYMFYENLGGTARSNINAVHNANFDLFLNVPAVATYWSGSEFVLETDNAWFFAVYEGYQGAQLKTGGFSAWAVRPGDVPSAVPEPSSFALTLACLSAFGVSARRRR